MSTTAIVGLRAAFEIADIGSVQAGLMRERLLRPAFRLAQPAHVEAEAGTDLHTRLGPASRRSACRRSVAFALYCRALRKRLFRIRQIKVCVGRLQILKSNGTGLHGEGKRH